MEKKQSAIIIILLVIALGGGFLLLNNNTDTGEGIASPPGNKNQAPVSGDFTIKITPEGFSPEEITIKKGQTITWVNETDEFRWPASNLHPTHGIYPEFDPQEPIAPGESWSFTFDKAGTWRFHDHLNPRMLGKIEVVDDK